MGAGTEVTKLLPSKQHVYYQILPTYSHWGPATLECCISQCSLSSWISEQTYPTSTHPGMLLVLLCSSAAEEEQRSRSSGGAPWTTAGHMVGMWAVLQDWDCSSTVAKQKEGERERRRAELLGKCAVDSLLGLLRDSWQLLWSPHHETQGWFVVTCTEYTVFLLRNKLVLFRRDYIHSWNYMQVLGLFSGL